MKNSILVAYRDRPPALQCFLDSLDSLPADYELVIIDLGSRENTAALIAPHSSRLPIRHLYVDYDGVFHKTKALNYGLKRTDAEWITMMDADCLFPERYFHDVDAFLDAHPKTPKLSYRIYKYPFSFFRHVLFPTPAPEWLKFFHDNVTSAKRHYPNPCYEEYRGHYTGNSHMTIRRECLMAVGGWNEQFIGYGLEDHEINMRLWVQYGDTLIRQDKPLFQVANEYENNWLTKKSDTDNREVFAESEAHNFEPIPILPGFGEFETYRSCAKESANELTNT